jgi:ubiquinone/menaquinone biosynthesis C-methylase UbiE
MNDHVAMLSAYFDLMNCNGAANVYRVALEAGLLDAIAEGPLTAEEVAVKCQSDPRATELVLQTLEAMRLTAHADGKWSLTPLAGSLLSGGYRQLGQQYWDHLPKLLKTGEPWIHMDDASQSAGHYQSQAAALAWMLAPAAEAAAIALGVGEREKNLSILDLGAGSASWSLTMARRDAGATVTAVDWPAVLAVARATAAKFGLSDRLTTIAGNYHEVELPEAVFDLAILGNVTHLETPEGNRDLLTRTRGALKAGGRVVIFDVLPGQASGDLNRTLYTLGLALRTRAGHVYTPGELETLLTETGFAKPRLVNLEVPPRAVGMLVAEAP